MKRIFLISLLLILVLGFSANAFDLPKIPSLKVELVAPENIKVGEPFWVDVYLTPAFKETIGNTKIDLKTSSSDLYFVGGVVQMVKDTPTIIPGVQQGAIFGTNVKLEMNNQDGSWIILGSVGKWMALQGKKKMASVKMMVKTSGVHSINLVKEKSYSYFDEQNSQLYSLLSTPAVTISAGCVPKLKICSDLGTVKMGDGPALVFPNCGYLDDDCGTAIKCGECNTYCVNNVCMASEIVLFPPTAAEKELCKTILTVTSGSPETTKNEIDLITGIASALKEQTFNAKFSGIVTALTTWFKAAKQ
ncbi:MAG: hypothetical protein AABW48_02635 [Nanoarchaeota archaeon]